MDIHVKRRTGRQAFIRASETIRTEEKRYYTNNVTHIVKLYHAANARQTHNANPCRKQCWPQKKRRHASNDRIRSCSRGPFFDNCRESNAKTNMTKFQSAPSLFCCPNIEKYADEKDTPVCEMPSPLMAPSSTRHPPNAATKRTV